MKRIDTATKVADLFGAGKHGLKDGNKALGIIATQLSAAWCNSIQEELSRVIEAAGIALDGNVYNQLLLALRSAGVFTTPPQFDNSTKVATMEAVQRALGSFSGARLITATATLTVVDAGKAISVQGAAPIVVTLPLLSDVAVGTAILLTSQSQNTVTMQRQGADVLAVNNLNPSLTSLTIGDGESALSVKQNSTTWVVHNSTAALKYAAGFGSSLAASGYQKIPGGLILQWGTVAVGGAGSTPVTYPIAFPTQTIQVIAGTQYSGSGTPSNLAAASGTNYTANGFTIGSTGAMAMIWFALGK